MSQEDKPVAWDPVSTEDGMRYPDISELIGGETDCDKSVAQHKPLEPTTAEDQDVYNSIAQNYKPIAAQKPIARVVQRIIPAGHGTKERVTFDVEWLTVDPYAFTGNLYANTAPCARCEELEDIIAEELSPGATRVAELQAKLTEQAAYIVNLQSQLEEAEQFIQELQEANGL